MHIPLLKLFRQNKVFRIAIGACALIIAGLLQYRLTNSKVPIEIGATGKFSPATVDLNREELVIDGPIAVKSSDEEEAELLLYETKANEILDATFDNARLDKETIEDLSNSNFNPPSTSGRIRYYSSEPKQTPAAGEPCRTFLTIETIDHNAPRTLHFYQPEEPSTEHLRHLVMQVTGAAVRVRMSTRPPPEVTREAVGCRKVLLVGGLPRQYLSGASSFEVVAMAEPNSSMDFRLQLLDPKAPSWNGGAAGFFWLLRLGPIDQNSPTATFQARGVSIRKRQEAGLSSPPRLFARSSDRGQPLSVSGMEVGSDQLKIRVSGVGDMSVNGQAETVNRLQQVENLSPLTKSMLLALNAGLIAWFIRLLSRKSMTTSTKSATND